MSTDVITFQTRYYRAARDLEAANAKVGQAERAKEDAELEARRAEERARQYSDDADGWRMFAHALAGEHLIHEYSETLTGHQRDAVIDHLHDLWAQGTDIDNLDVAGLVNDYTESS
jgi:hypothetical protein